MNKTNSIDGRRESEILVANSQQVAHKWRLGIAVGVLILIIGIMIWSVQISGHGDADIGQQEECLIVYTPHPIEFVKPLVEEFEHRTGIRVEVVTGGSGELIERIQEGQEADVLWGGSYFTVSPYSDLFEDYVTENEAYYLTAYQNREGNMTRFTDVPSVLLVNTDLIGDIEVKGYWDLLQPELKGKIAFANPAKSSSSFEQLINMLYACGNGIPEDGWDYVRELCRNLDGKLLDSSSDVYNGVAEGRYVVGLTFEEAGATLIKDGEHVKIIYMEEGVVSTPDGIYLVKKQSDASNSQAFRSTVQEQYAKQFIDFLTGYDAQYMITQRLGRRSVRKDLPQSHGLPTKKELHILYANDKEVLEKREQWVMRFQEIYQEECQ